jgi:oxygen-independent coproporphyrinogen-3 oxidase
MQAALYVHWAFCPYICPYCDFAKWAYDDRAAARYVAALEAEIAVAPALAATTVFYGGGTPNAYPPEVLVRVLAALRVRFGVRDDAEVSTEANPDRGLTAGFATLRAGGFNRAVIRCERTARAGPAPHGGRRRGGGSARALRRLQQRQSRSDVRRSGPDRDLVGAFARCGDCAGRRARFDLWAHDRRRHAVRQLAGARSGRLFRRHPRSAGYEHYEISNFARPGYRCEHNANYWRNGTYLGLGVGAASYLHGVRSTHTRERAEYEAAALAGEPIPGDSEELTGDARTGEAGWLALRTSEGVDTRMFRERYAVDVFTHYAPVIAEYAAAGLLDADERGIRLTMRGRFLANDVCGAFLAGT